jgi:hypothetical protein
MATKKNDDINREALLKIANLVRPALAAQPYIPALTHICLQPELGDGLQRRRSHQRGVRLRHPAPSPRGLPDPCARVVQR